MVDGDADAVAIEQVDHGLVASLFLPGGTTACGELDNTALIKLIRLFTLGEMQHANWQTGAKSPVVPLVKLLKKRGVFDVELGRWIKANTTNRFLPHGDLSAFCSLGMEEFCGKSATLRALIFMITAKA